MATPISAAQAAEIKRKATSGIPLTNPTTESTALYNQYKTTPVASPVSASTAASTANKTPSVSVPQPGTTQSAQAWINDPRSGQGGMDAYTAAQQQKYNNAYASSDQDMIARLNSDMQRVGYSLQTPQQPQQNVPQPPIDYNAIAQGESAYELARQRSRAEQEKQGLTSAYNRSNQIQTDNRLLGDSTRTQVANPFANMGRRSFDEALIGRERTLQDEQAQGQYNAAISGVEQGLTDYENTAAAEIRARAYQLEQDAKQLALQEGGLTGSYNGQRTLAGQEFDWSKDANNPAVVSQNISNKIAQLNLDSLPKEIKLNLDKLQQDVATGKINQSTAEYQLKELTDPNSMTNKARALDLQMKELEAANLPEMQRLQLQQLKKSIAQIGKVAPVSEYDRQMQEIKLDTAREELAKLRSGNGSNGIDDKTSAGNAFELQQELLKNKPDADTAYKYLQSQSSQLSPKDYQTLLTWIQNGMKGPKTSTSDLFSELFSGGG